MNWWVKGGFKKIREVKDASGKIIIEAYNAGSNTINIKSKSTNVIAGAVKETIVTFDLITNTTKREVKIVLDRLIKP